jgi:hypothetical protein
VGNRRRHPLRVILRRDRHGVSGSAPVRRDVKFQKRIELPTCSLRVKSVTGYHLLPRNTPINVDSLQGSIHGTSDNSR